MRFTPLLDRLFDPGHAIAAEATEDITLGQFVVISGNGTAPNPSVAIAEDGDRAFGLAENDADSGALVNVQRGSGRCFRVPTATAITAGADIQVGANGQPVPHSTGVVVAQALHTSANGHVDLTLV